MNRFSARFTLGELVLAVVIAGLAPWVAFAQTPIPIATLDDLNKIGRVTGYPLNGYYILTADIDASATASWNNGAGFQPIGNNTTPFTGTLDGQGHAIRNLTINLTSGRYAGLFRVIGSTGVVQNLRLEGGSVSLSASVEKAYAGFLAGFCGGTIRNCSSTGGVNLSCHYQAFGGGLIGKTEGGSISDAYATGSVTSSSSSYSSSYSYAGGLVGANNAALTNCYATGSVTSSS
ncbi:MAG TPA: GLUG motif-containing protein, partial [Candidatus Hydrogenedentes bacterium]|nr:GLUG motif-containing protein [Candidatus Hydrogenedentota bacterium]